jgi:hypothetical protein
VTIKRGTRSLADRCLDAAGGDPALALVYAIRVTRWRMIVAGTIDPAVGEPLPVEVRRARRHAAAQLAA